MTKNRSITLLTYPLGEGVQAFSTERHGGYSKGNYAEFNANAYCGDAPKHVKQNRELLAGLLNLSVDQLVIPHQVHGTTIRTIDDSYLEMTLSQRTEWLEGVDALITQRNDVCLCVSTADCIPIVIHDPIKHAIACIHAGWRGTVQRIVECTLGRMAQDFGTIGKDCYAAIGPGISKESFEVGEEVYVKFQEADFPMKSIATRWPATNNLPSKWHIDLPEANRLQLLSQGLIDSHIYLSNICTYQQSKRFFSARKLGVNSGRILTGIRLVKYD